MENQESNTTEDTILRVVELAEKQGFSHRKILLTASRPELVEKLRGRMEEFVKVKLRFRIELKTIDQVAADVLGKFGAVVGQDDREGAFRLAAQIARDRRWHPFSSVVVDAAHELGDEAQAFLTAIIGEQVQGKSLAPLASPQSEVRSPVVAQPKPPVPALPEADAPTKVPQPPMPHPTTGGRQISGYDLVEKILTRYGDDGVAKLLECVNHSETEYLELKASVELSESDKGKHSPDELYWDIAQCIFGIANTAGGALIIGILDDCKTLTPNLTIPHDGDYLTKQIVQKLLPDQCVWKVSKGKDGKGEKWEADKLPQVEPRFCRYSDGNDSKNVVVLLIRPQPLGDCLGLCETTQGKEQRLIQRKIGAGKNETHFDAASFKDFDHQRQIEREYYFQKLLEYVPDAVMTHAGTGSPYCFRPVEGRVEVGANDPIVHDTQGHRLRWEFDNGTCIGGKYVILEKLGEGGMGVVYRVKDRGLNTEYALKAFKESDPGSSALLKKRFQSEARLLKELTHPNIPEVREIDYDPDSECLFILQELIVGTDGRPHEIEAYTASPECAEKGNLKLVDELQLRKWLQQICEVVTYLHGKSIIHRDISLRNILVNDRNDVVLTDFGIAKVMDEKLRQRIDCCVTLSWGGGASGAPPAMLGTLHYIPPEVKNRRPDPRYAQLVDSWAVGVCFFYLLFGEWFDSQQFTDYDGKWPSPMWGEVFRGLLRRNVGERYTCEKVKELLSKRTIGEISDIKEKIKVQEKKLQSLKELQAKYEKAKSEAATNVVQKKGFLNRCSSVGHGVSRFFGWDAETKLKDVCGQLSKVQKRLQKLEEQRNHYGALWPDWW